MKFRIHLEQDEDGQFVATCPYASRLYFRGQDTGGSDESTLLTRSPAISPVCANMTNRFRLRSPKS